MRDRQTEKQRDTETERDRHSEKKRKKRTKVRFFSFTLITILFCWFLSKNQHFDPSSEAIISGSYSARPPPVFQVTE